MRVHAFGPFSKRRDVWRILPEGQAVTVSAGCKPALKWSMMTLAIAISGSASLQMPKTTPSRIWNANSVAGGMSSARRWMIGV